MRSTRISRARLLWIVALAIAPAVAPAAEPDASRPAPAAPWAGAELEFSFGLAPVHDVLRDSGLPVVFGLSALASLGHVLVGPVATVSLAQEGRFRDQSLYLGLAAGSAAHVSARWRAWALGEGGAHRVYDVRDRGLEDVYSSVWATGGGPLPYVGLRVGMGYEEPHERSWRGLFTRADRFGLALLVRRDLRSGTATVHYSDAWIVALPPVVRGSSTYAVGGWTAGIVLTCATAW